MYSIVKDTYYKILQKLLMRLCYHFSINEFLYGSRGIRTRTYNDYKLITVDFDFQEYPSGDPIYEMIEGEPNKNIFSQKIFT